MYILLANRGISLYISSYVMTKTALQNRYFN